MGMAVIKSLVTLVYQRPWLMVGISRIDDVVDRSHRVLLIIHYIAYTTYHVGFVNRYAVCI